LDVWVRELQALNERLQNAFSDPVLLSRQERRRILQQIGTLRPLRRLTDATAAESLGGRPLIGVDGTVNLFGGAFPYYVALLRATAVPNRGEPIREGQVYCPLPPDSAGYDDDVAARRDEEERQRKLADLELRVAKQSADMYGPSVLLLDGPLVRFDKRVWESFNSLREKVQNSKILVAGVIENLESRAIVSLLGPEAPAGWRHRYDREILWGALDPGEGFFLNHPSPRPATEDDREPTPLRRWFLRSALDPGVTGVEVLEAQVSLAEKRQLADLLHTMTPEDGRGIPAWMDLVDREVRLTDLELDAYAELIDPDLRRILTPKRDARVF
jgi:hypothetical protein